METIDNPPDNNESVLRQDVAHFYKSFRNIPIGLILFTIEPNKSQIKGNPAMMRMFEYETQEALHTLSFKDLFMDSKGYNAFIKKLTAHGEITAEEVRLKKKDGTLIWCAFTANSLLDESGHLIYYYGLLEDITQRKRVEQLFKEEKNFSEAIIESLPGLFFMIDRKDRYVKWNNNAEKIYGYTFDEISSMPSSSRIWPGDLAKVNELGRKLFHGEPTDYNEYNVMTKDGRKVPVAAVAKKVIIAGTEYAVGMEIDISKRKKVEEDLKRALSEINVLKDQIEAENTYLVEQINKDKDFGNVIGQSSALKQALLKIKQVSATNTTVLILGETGAGKGLLARAVHNLSARKDRPLITVNCASLPDNLIESELFGHEKGAFTGADKMKPGRFEVANGSTIFLDEISELPLGLQAKLLRAVEEGEIERLGSTRSIKINARIIAATNRDLEQEVKNGRFRSDLWYRLNVFPITAPPLRDRKEDIPLLTSHFLNKFAREMGKHIDRANQDTIDALTAYPWPGNVRELKNVIERAVITSTGPVLQDVEIPKRTRILEMETSEIKTLAELERDYILKILEKTNWRISGPNGAAKMLGLHPNTLRGRMLKLGIRKKTLVPQF